MKQQLESVRSGFLLLLAAFIWGIAFVAQSVGMDYMGPCTFNASRFLIGGVVLLPVIWTKERMEEKKGATGALAKKNKSGALLPGGVCCGIALCAGRKRRPGLDADIGRIGKRHMPDPQEIHLRIGYAHASCSFFTAQGHCLRHISQHDGILIEQVVCKGQLTAVR